MGEMIFRVEGGPENGRSIAVPAQGGIIGRQVGLEIALADPLLSRRHARIEVRDGRLLLCDLGSASGTRVNGQLIDDARELRAGDLLELGTSRLRLVGAADQGLSAMGESQPLPSSSAERDTVVRSDDAGATPSDGAMVANPPVREGRARSVAGQGTLLNNRYRLDRQIGRGGFSRVYLATDLTLDRLVAIKVLAPELLAQSEEHDFLARFATEARVVARLDHPNILSVFDYGQVGNTAYLVMPHVEGGSLHHRLRQGASDGPARPLDPAVATLYLRQAAAALDYAHRRHLVHRDIKPQNMLLRAEDDRLLLADFGIAKVLGSTRAQTSTGIVGTLAYMAPELLRGHVGRAVDIYALGCVAFQLVTGQLPFTGSTARVMRAHLNEPVPQLATRGGAHLPAGLQGVLEQALAKDPLDRFVSAGDFARAFAAALSGEPRAFPAPDFAAGVGDAETSILMESLSATKPPSSANPFSPAAKQSDQRAQASVAQRRAQSPAGSGVPATLTPARPVRISRRALIAGAAGAGVSFIGLCGFLLTRGARDGGGLAATAALTGSSITATPPPSPSSTAANALTGAIAPPTGTTSAAAAATPTVTTNVVAAATPAAATSAAGAATPTVRGDAPVGLRVNSLATPRAYHTATALLDGTVLVTGGGESTALATAERFDPATGTWLATPTMADARAYHAAALLDRQVLVCGGVGVDGKPIASAELYDPFTNAWRMLAPMRTPRKSPTVTPLPGGLLLVSGGQSLAVESSAELYDPTANAWRDAGKMSAGRIDHRAVLIPQGEVLITGAYGSTRDTVTEVYRPTTNQWSVVSPMATGRAGHTATLLDNGKVLAVGGSSGTKGASPSAEAWDFATNMWSPVASLRDARRYHAAVPLADGRGVLVCGGENGASLDSIELFTAAADACRLLGRMVTPRTWHTATLLGGGQVLVVGGLVGGTKATDTVEIITVS